MSELYSIRNWERDYEVAQSRRIKGPLDWVAMTTKLDGKRYRRLVAMKNPAELLGAWMLLVEVAATCEVRGVLEDRDGPLTSDDLATKTGISSKVFDRAFEVFSSKDIGWLTRSMVDDAQPCSERATTTGQDSTEQDKTEQDIAAPSSLDLFEKFWSAFPPGRKHSPGRARPAWDRAIKKAAAETIIAAAGEYAASPLGMSDYVSGPEPWLNGERWNDDRTSWNRKEANARPTTAAAPTGAGQRHEPNRRLSF